jgi:hypothetical protein
MPRISADATPKYRRHKASGQAIVTLSGRDNYLGPYGTAASWREYDRLVVAWIANGRATPLPKTESTVVELIAAYLRHAKEYYRGSSEIEATNTRSAHYKSSSGGCSLRNSRR